MNFNLKATHIVLLRRTVKVKIKHGKNTLENLPKELQIRVLYLQIKDEDYIELAAKDAKSAIKYKPTFSLKKDTPKDILNKLNQYVIYMPNIDVDKYPQ